MLQRIQTVFLLLAAAATICVFFFPLASFLSEFAYYKLYIYEFRSMTPDTVPVFSYLFTLPLVLLNAVAGLMSLITIFLYKKRVMQMRLLRLAIFLLLVFVALIFFYYAPTIEKEINAIPDYKSDYGIYLPFIALIFMILADKFIRKDEKLIRSADRLR